MSESRMPDNLEAFLQNPPSGAADGEVRADLLEHTSTLLPRTNAWPRWPVYLSAAACLMLVFAAGFVLAWLRMTASVPAAIERVAEPKKEAPPIPPQFVPPPKLLLPEPQPPPQPKPRVTPPTDPRALEWSAFDAENDQDRARLYFRAGDLYLAKHDVNAALRCYQQAFTYGDAHDLEPNPDDNWLLLALKRDHRKEN